MACGLGLLLQCGCFIYGFTLSNHCNCRKYQKKTATKIGCGFFLPAWSTVVKQVHIWYFGLATETLGIWGCEIYRWKGLEFFSNGIWHAPNIIKLQLQTKKIKKLKSIVI
jgi:hypothetical protein